MRHLLDSFRFKLPFLIAGFASMLLSIFLYFVQEEKKTAAIFVGLWVPSIHSLGTLLLSSDPSHATDPVRSEQVLS